MTRRERTEADDIVQGASNRALLDLILPSMRRAAKDVGYAITVHGSLNRDVDLVAIPWRDHGVWTHDALADTLMCVIRGITGRCHREKDWKDKPHGRRANSMFVWCGETTTHLDISYMPPQEKPDESD